jgi:hypothetical protein
MKETMKNEFMSVLEEVRTLLNDNSEWRERYVDYAEKIQENIPFINSVRSSFREWSPLKIYLNITSAKTAKNTVIFDLRYMGQTVARLKGKKDKVHKLSTKDLEDTNMRYFGCDICLPDADWCGEEAARFRGFFKNRKGPRNAGSKRNEEHRLESLLLTEFFKRKSKHKALQHIQPVTIGRVRFPMPTPIGASKHKSPKYSGTKGGGIDILTRTGTGGRATRLCIMELKDENYKNEPPKEVMKQAIAYTTFIRELLRSDSGSAWWRIFGFGGKIPEPLELFAACVMPSIPNNDCSFSNTKLCIGMDTIKLHYLYFTEETREISKIIIKPGDTTLAITE